MSSLNFTFTRPKAYYVSSVYLFSIFHYPLYHITIHILSPHFNIHTWSRSPSYIIYQLYMYITSDRQLYRCQSSVFWCSDNSGARVGHILGQIGHKWDKSGTHKCWSCPSCWPRQLLSVNISKQRSHGSVNFRD